MVKVRKHTSYGVEFEGREYEVQHLPLDGDDPIIRKLDDGRVVIGYLSHDDDPMHPRKDNDNLGKMTCWHRRYNLGDKHDHENPTKFWAFLLGEEKFEEMEEQVENELYEWRQAHKEMSFSDPAYQKLSSELYRVMHTNVQNQVRENYILLPLYLMDHSGLSISTGSFSHCDPGGWDSGQVGWIYISHEDLVKNWSVKSMADLVDYKNGEPAKSARDRAIDLLNGEVAEYDHYLSGECYGICVESFDSNGDELGGEEEACWGFLGSEYAEGELKDRVESQVKRLTQEKKGDD